MGLTTWKDAPNGKIMLSDTKIAKNYLSKEELDILNRMVSAYLDIAEINALNMHAMTMEDWKKELDSFLTMTHKEILQVSSNKLNKAILLLLEECPYKFLRIAEKEN